MATVVGVNAGDKGFVRRVQLSLACSCHSASKRLLKRSIHKIVLIKEAKV